jgi:hypothetical protein
MKIYFTVPFDKNGKPVVPKAMKEMLDKMEADRKADREDVKEMMKEMMNVNLKEMREEIKRG